MNMTDGSEVNCPFQAYFHSFLPNSDDRDLFFRPWRLEKVIFRAKSVKDWVCMFLCVVSMFFEYRL